MYEKYACSDGMAYKVHGDATAQHEGNWQWRRVNRNSNVQTNSHITEIRPKIDIRAIQKNHVSISRFSSFLTQYCTVLVQYWPSLPRFFLKRVKKVTVLFTDFLQ